MRMQRSAAVAGWEQAEAPAGRKGSEGRGGAWAPGGGALFCLGPARACREGGVDKQMRS